MQVQESLHSQSTVFISLVTGNWIRIRETNPRCPIPLARGFGHLAVKQALFDYADEVFVIAPLGKIFADSSERRQEIVSEAVNSDLHLREGGAYDIYREVNVPKKAGAKVKLISTSRPAQGRLLSEHSKIVADRAMAYCLDDGLDISEHEDPYSKLFSSAEIENVRSVMFRFNDLPNDALSEEQIEFPHPYTRNPHFLRAYFRVTRD